MKRLLKSLMSAMLLGAFLTGCVVSNDRGPDGPEPKDGTAQVRFKVELPSLTTQKTRASHSASETTVDNIYVLIFDNAGDWVDHKVVTAANMTVTSSDADNALDVCSFTVALPMSASDNAAHKYDIVLVANVVDDLATIVAAQIAAEADKATFMAALELSKDGNLAFDGTAHEAMPMISLDKGAMTIETTTDFTGSDAFRLMRMYARIDVLFGAALPNHKVTEVYLYNYNTAGNLWHAGLTGDSAPATAVNLPAAPGKQTDDKFMVANAAADMNAFREQMYAFEAEVDGTDTKRPCLVVRLSDDTGSDMGYYRMEFQKADDTWLDILRNYRYVFTINKVGASGFADPDTAYRAGKANLQVDIIPWDEGNVSGVKFDEYYFLGVNKPQFELFRNAQTTAREDKSNILVITTDVPTGWEIIDIEYEDTDLGSGWLTPSKPDGSDRLMESLTGGSTEVLLSVVQENISGLPRKAFITIAAGRLTYKVEVIQSNVAAFEIQLLDENDEPVNELFFKSKTTAADARTVKLYYGPWDAPLDVNYTYVNDNEINWGIGAGRKPESITAGAGNTLGTYVYNIRPESFLDDEIDDTKGGDPFLTKTARIRFEVEDPVTKNLKSALLYVYQRTPNLTLAQTSMTAAYTGGTYNVIFSTNDDWVAEISANGLASDIGAQYVSATSGGAGDNQIFQFSMPASTTNKIGEPFQITFRSPTNQFDPKVVEVNPSLPSLDLDSYSAAVTCAADGIAAVTRTFTINTSIPASQLKITYSGVVSSATLDPATNKVTVTVKAATAAAQTGSVVVSAGSLSQTFSVTRDAPTLTASASTIAVTCGADGIAAVNKTVTLTSNCAANLITVSGKTGVATGGSVNGSKVLTVNVGKATSANQTGTITATIGGIKNVVINVTREAPTLTASASSVAFTCAANGIAAASKTITLTSNCAASLITVSGRTGVAASGSVNGSKVLTINASAATASAQSGTITVTIGGVVSKAITVTRDAPTLTISPTTLSLPYSSAATTNNTSISITSNCAYGLITVHSKPSFVTAASVTSGKKLSATVAKSTTAAQTGTIVVTIKNGSTILVQKSVTVTRAKNPGELVGTVYAGPWMGGTWSEANEYCKNTGGNIATIVQYKKMYKSDNEIARDTPAPAYTPLANPSNNRKWNTDYDDQRWCGNDVNGIFWNKRWASEILVTTTLPTNFHFRCVYE